VNDNPYEQLLPHWHAFCEARRSVESARQHHKTSWLIHVGARNTMHSAWLDWVMSVGEVCGVGTSVEWPEQVELYGGVSPECYIEGSCIVNGIMMFS
jgi:hypothetical protein